MFNLLIDQTGGLSYEERKNDLGWAHACMLLENVYSINMVESALMSLLSNC